MKNCYEITPVVFSLFIQEKGIVDVIRNFVPKRKSWGRDVEVFSSATRGELLAEQSKNVFSASEESSENSPNYITLTFKEIIT